MTRTTRIQHTRRVFVKDRWGRKVCVGHVERMTDGNFTGHPLSPLDKARIYPKSDLARQYVIRCYQSQGGV